MKVSAERTPESQMVLDIEMEPEEMERSLEKAYRRLVPKANIPGFRRGKAPRAMLERYLGRAALLEEAIEQMVPEAYNQAIQEQKIEAIGRPQVEITQAEPLTFKATVPLPPTVELGDYRQIREELESVEVTEEQVNSVIEELRFQQAPWEPVDRPVQFGDLLTLEVEGSLEGKAFLSEKNLAYRPMPDLTFPLPGFAQQLEGIGKGDVKEFTLSFPSDYATQELAGKDGLFRVSVKEIKEKRLPELNDEFAKGVGEGSETLDSLKEKVSNDLRTGAEEEAKRRCQEKALDLVVEGAQVEFPPILVEVEVDRIIAEQTQRLGESGIRFEGYLKSLGKTEEEFREELKPIAIKRVSRSLVMEKLAELEKIEVAPEEIDEDLETMAQGAGERGEEIRQLFDSSPNRDSLKRVLLARKTMQRLVEIATGEAALRERIWTPPKAEERVSQPGVRLWTPSGEVVSGRGGKGSASQGRGKRPVRGKEKEEKKK